MARQIGDLPHALGESEALAQLGASARLREARACAAAALRKKRGLAISSLGGEVGKSLEPHIIPISSVQAGKCLPVTSSSPNGWSREADRGCARQ
jgi:hypothetical protein